MGVVTATDGEALEGYEDLEQQGAEMQPDCADVDAGGRRTGLCAGASPFTCMHTRTFTLVLESCN